jgi:anti-sigma factor RsiW
LSPAALAPEAATCREFIGRLDDYVDEDLPGEARGRLDRHLVRCRGCAAYIRSYGRSIEIGRAAVCAGERAAGGLPEGLVQAVLSSRLM